MSNFLSSFFLTLQHITVIRFHPYFIEAPTQTLRATGGFPGFTQIGGFGPPAAGNAQRTPFRMPTGFPGFPTNFRPGAPGKWSIVINGRMACLPKYIYIVICAMHILLDCSFHSHDCIFYASILACSLHLH